MLFGMSQPCPNPNCRGRDIPAGAAAYPQCGARLGGQASFDGGANAKEKMCEGGDVRILGFQPMIHNLLTEDSP
jgi:hypothetical protein